MKYLVLMATLLGVISLKMGAPALAADPAVQAAPVPAAPVQAASGPAGPKTDPTRTTTNRRKSIDFEDEVVEGMNKNPLDSLQHLGKNDQRNAAHLYRKRTQFKKEIRQTASEIGSTP